MYGRIPTEINPSETSTKLTYVNSFDHEFSLHLIERRSVTLFNMQEATLEVESNILASNRLKQYSDHRGYAQKGKKETIPPASTS